MTDTSDSDLGKNGKDGVKEILAAGSRALLHNSPLEATENYKSVLDKLSYKSNQKMSISQLVLRYALCIALVKCNDYKHIAEGVESLLELIHSGCANKLPVLYLALARAYYALNRFKKSLEYVEKGLKAIQTNSKVKQHLWPGLQLPIDETTKESLQKELLSLQKDCKKSHPPDALCKFDKCLVKTSTCSHLIPARDIFFTDPDFEPFLHIQCDANCKYSYHNSCWEHLKQVNLNLAEPMDLLGAACLNDTCSSKINNDSVVVEVNLIGSEGFDKPINTWILPDKNLLSIKIDSGSTASPNGSPSKSCMRKSGTGVRTSSEVQCSAVHVNVSSEERQLSSVQSIPEEKKNPTPVQLNPVCFLPQRFNCPQQPQRFCPVSTASNGLLFRANASCPPRFPSFASLGSRPPFHVPMSIPSPGFFECPSFWPQAHISVPRTQNFGYLPHVHLPPPTTHVEVVVRNTSLLTAGTTLVVPLGPTGGPVQIKQACSTSDCSSVSVSGSEVSALPLGPPPMLSLEKAVPSLPATRPPVKSPVDEFKTKVKKFAQGASPQSTPCIREPAAVMHAPKEADDMSQQATTTSLKSVVDEFRSVVKRLAGEPAKSAVLPTMSSSTFSDSEEVSMKQVVKEFQRLVHDLARCDASNNMKSEVPKTSSVLQEAAQAALDVNMNYRDKPSSNEFSSRLPLGHSNPSNSRVCNEVIPVRIADNYVFPSTGLDRFMTQQSTFQAKSKSLHRKENQNFSEQSFIFPSSIASSLCSSQDDIRSEPLDSTKLASLLEVLNQCRKMEFGYTDGEYMNPELQCFGLPYADFSTYVVPDEIVKADKAEADFVFSYYYSLFKINGQHRLEDLQETWKATISDDIGLPETFTDKYSSVSEFLLKSERFAAIDDWIGTYELLPDMFSKAQAVITESVSYLLFSQVSNACSKKDTLNNSWKTKINNNNCDSHTHHSSTASDTDEYESDDSKEGSDGCESSKVVTIMDKDSNDNPIHGATVSLISNKTPVSSFINPFDEPFVLRDLSNSPKPEVYMSEEDEEMDSIPAALAGNDKPDVVDQASQTDEIIDKEKEKFAEIKENLFKEISELRYEKDELHQRIVSLQLQMESNFANQESHHSKALKQVQEKHDEELQRKTEELKTSEDKYCALEKELILLKEQIKDKDIQVSELHSSLQKIQRSNAKEMNNFVKRSQEEKLLKEEEFKSLLQYKDQRYFQLWKDFCEFKIKKFNQSCNDRINVLSQLRDMVSDSIQPTKSDIKSSIEKYEEEMITVTQKNAEVNDVFNHQMDKLRNGLEVQLPSVVDVPDTMNLHYPPEGAFEYLRSMLKPKLDDFAIPQNHFSPAVSRFYPRPLASNGLQSLSQPRENEGFPSVSNSSIFGRGHNETSQFWNNSFSTPSAAPSAMPFDVNNSSIPHPSLHQGFGGPNPMMVQQPALNLMSSLMSYQPSASQNSSVQSLIGQRSTPSPLSFPTVNGNAFSSNNSASSILGSKAPGLSAVPKPVPSAAAVLPSNPLMKNLPSTTPASVSTAAVSLGAIPKPRVHTATASMTPIVPSKSLVRPVPKGTKTNDSNYEKLMRNLQKMFPTRNDMELTQALKMTREKNGNTLSSLSHSEIVSKVEEVFNTHMRKQTSMGWEKFGQAAWGTAKAPVIEWEGQEQDECCICMAPMHAKEVYTLECKHSFHKECIRQWLEQDSVCPNCRMHSTMLDEFPPLA